MWPGGKEAGSPAPAEVVIVRVEEPGARPAGDCEHDGDDEEEETRHQVQTNIDQDEVVTKPEPHCLGCLEGDHDAADSAENTEDEAEDEETLGSEEPGRHQPFSDLMISVAPDTVTSVEQHIKLEPGEAESVEADLPGTHPGEGRVGVLPWDEPGWWWVSNDEQSQGHCSSNAGNIWSW